MENKGNKENNGGNGNKEDKKNEVLIVAQGCGPRFTVLVGASMKRLESAGILLSEAAKRTGEVLEMVDAALGSESVVERAYGDKDSTAYVEGLATGLLSVISHMRMAIEAEIVKRMLRGDEGEVTWTHENN